MENTEPIHIYKLHINLSWIPKIPIQRERKECLKHYSRTFILQRVLQVVISKVLIATKENASRKQWPRLERNLQ